MKRMRAGAGASPTLRLEGAPGPGARPIGSRPLAAVAALCAARTLGALAVAAQWIVDDDGPADFSKIQAAIDAAYVLPGDTILVRPGTYREYLTLDTKDLVVRSEKGPFVTTIDALKQASVVSLVDRSSATRIEGFTLTGGEDPTGGGVWIIGGAPIVTRNVIRGNSAVGGTLGFGYGGGIEVYSSAAVVTRNVITGNSALDGGAGIDVYYAGPSTPGTCCPVITQNTIVGNVVHGSTGLGGGIFSLAAQPLISSCVISNNQAAAGGGIYVLQRGVLVNDTPDVSTSLFFADFPDDAASDGSWRLPPSNTHADPRLGAGDGTALWPRSDSPALDAAEAGAPAGPDLSGWPLPVDSDLDGTARADIGALENRSEITGLTASPDPTLPDGVLLRWDDSRNPSVVFNVYQQAGNPFVTSGGVCLASGLASPGFSDSGAPRAGEAWYYLVTGQGQAEGSRGFRSDGTPRPPSPSCTAP